MQFVRLFLLTLPAAALALFIPIGYLLLAGVAVLAGHRWCYKLDWPRYRQLLGSLYGGLALGLGLQFIVGYAVAGDWLAMVLAPIIVWPCAFVLFMLVSEPIAAGRSARKLPSFLIDELPNPALRPDGTIDLCRPESKEAPSAFRTFMLGEICMGGPSVGEIVFGNGCAFDSMFDEVRLLGEGRYAQLSPASAGGYLLVDLFEGRCFALHDEIADVESLAGQLAGARELPMVQDDGWWVLDFPGRESFPNFAESRISSSGGHHVVNLIPDTRGMLSNPFRRFSRANYQIRVDGEVQDQLVRGLPRVQWIDDVHKPEENEDWKRWEGRFLMLNDDLLDLCAVRGYFSVDAAIRISLGDCDPSTRLNFEAMVSEAPGQLTVTASAMPRCTGRDEPENCDASHAYPSDDSEVCWWDGDGREHVHVCSLARRLYRYGIELSELSKVGSLRVCADIELINRARPEHTVRFTYESGSNRDHKSAWGGYRCHTSCGLDPGLVAHEAIWSACGRYLAVVGFAAFPDVPHDIRIIDFDTATLRRLPGRYALPSFIWLDAQILDFSHIVGVQESLVFGPGRHEDRSYRFDDGTAGADAFELLIGGLDSRRSRLTELKAQDITFDQGVHPSVHLINQHCVLFAPDYAKPVLQPRRPDLGKRPE